MGKWTMTLQMTQNKKIQDLLYFKGKIEETNIIIKNEKQAKIDFNLNIMVSINIQNKKCPLIDTMFINYK